MSNNFANDQSDWNRNIYHNIYAPETQELNPISNYDIQIIKFRVDLLKKYCSGTVIDMGCGIGEYSREAAKFSEIVYGVDFSQIYIREAIKRSAHQANIFICVTVLKT